MSLDNKRPKGYRKAPIRIAASRDLILRDIHGQPLDATGETCQRCDNRKAEGVARTKFGTPMFLCVECARDMLQRDEIIIPKIHLDGDEEAV